MFDRFSLLDLNIRLLGAPMATGPSTPALAAAVSNCGGLGLLAGGMQSAEEMSDSILAARKLTSGPIGVNLIVPQRSVVSVDQLCAYATALVPQAEKYGVELGESRQDDFGWTAKLEVVCDLRPEVVSFTFGAPSELESRRLSGLGIVNLVTVTTVCEAMIATRCGVDALVAQGYNAGGHRATFDACARPSDGPLDELVAALVACFDRPVVAAGGLGTRADIDRVRRAGATAVQVGTALLLADEAGTSRLHRHALRDPQFSETTVTRAFTGRYGRALRNRFTNQHDADAVSGFPEVAMLTAPLQAAALKMEDPHGIPLWAGSAFRSARTGPAAEIVRALAG
jgi:nitronate monooxygenase